MNLVQDSTTRAAVADPSTRNLEIIYSPKCVRVYFGGELIASSKNVILLRQKGGEKHVF